MNLFNNMAGINLVAKSLFAMKKYIKPIDNARASGDFEDEKKHITAATKAWAEGILEKLEVQMNIINAENLPDSGPVVYVANHQSYGDIFAFLYAVPHQVGFIAKSDLKKVPVLNGWVDRIRGLFIDRGDVRSSLDTINQGVEYMKQGFSLVIFPEGTRSQKREMAHFKPGALKLATKAGATIVPVTLDGGYKAFEENGALTKHTKINMLIHEPIDTSTLSRQELAELPLKVEGIIREGLNSLQML